MKPPIYEPAGKAKEYGDLALNIYTGCNHGCFYCFAPNVLHKTKESFSADVKPRDGIIEETRKQLEKEKITGKLIHLCFTCDPYPADVDTSATREIIKLLKEHGNHVQILTKGGRRAYRDFDLLDENDWFGVTVSGAAQEQEPNSAPQWERIQSVATLKETTDVKTWVSFEPVINVESIYSVLQGYRHLFDRFKFGKLNYHPSEIDWRDFGMRVEGFCQFFKLDYYIKDSLRKEMEK